MTQFKRYTAEDYSMLHSIYQAKIIDLQMDFGFGVYSPNEFRRLLMKAYCDYQSEMAKMKKSEQETWH